MFVEEVDCILRKIFDLGQDLCVGVIFTFFHALCCEILA